MYSAAKPKLEPTDLEGHDHFVHVAKLLSFLVFALKVLLAS